MVQSTADRRMWRSLLARLHPDAGGDPESFLLACALRQRFCEEFHPAPVWEGTDPDHFLRTWRDAMSLWAAGNRSTLKGFRSRCGKLEV